MSEAAALFSIDRERPIAYSPTLLQEIGSYAEHGDMFTPIVNLSKYPAPNCVLHASNGPDASQALIIVTEYFENEFWKNRWDIYYVWPPFAIADRALLLVPSSQADKFWNQANEDLSAYGIALPPLDEVLGMKTCFHGRNIYTLPRYLGFCYSHNEYKCIERHVPNICYLDTAARESYNALESTKLEKFYAMIPPAHIVLEPARRIKNEHGEVPDFETWKATCVLKQATQFFGFSPAPAKGPTSAETAGLGYYYIGGGVAKDELQSLKSLRSVANVVHAPPHPFDSNVVFVSIDVEAWERGKEITQIGISTLDTNDLRELPAGRNGVNWRSKIVSQHFRVIENRHLRNVKYVGDAPADFRFGKSTFIKQEDIGSLKRFFEMPYEPGEGPRIVERHNHRIIVLVGLDIENDAKFLVKSRFFIKDVPYLHINCPIIDIQKIFNILTCTPMGQKPSLANVLQACEILPMAPLHNAGNDARYTLEALLAMVVNCVSESEQTTSEEIATGHGQDI